MAAFPGGGGQGGAGGDDFPKKGRAAFPDLDAEAEQCRVFLETFDLGNNTMKYLLQLSEIKARKRRSLDVLLGDVEAFNAHLADNVQENTLRYQTLLARAADFLLSSGVVPEPEEADMGRMDTFDIWNQHRSMRLAATQGGDPNSGSPGLPAELTRRFTVNIIPQQFPMGKTLNLRDIRADKIGQLISVRGMVARVSDVKPLVEVVAYICSDCGWETYQTVKDRTFTPLTACPTEVCQNNNVKGEIFQQTRGSKFVRFQEIRLQELPHEVPQGNVPRAITLRVYGDLTRSCTPGQIVTVAGISLPARYTGYRAVRAGLTADSYVHATALEAEKKSFIQAELTEEVLEEVEDLRDDYGEDLVSNLARSIAPEIYGMEDVKKALLLLVVGAPTRKMADGMTIRGDLNVLLMGDPGVAKSQLLKHISKIAPRSVYTTGKGSSGVGLTAAVVPDPVSGEMALEGGALVLADMGICCIDEFDKMEEGDRTAIHEVMEQQTVSIAKAGITTTLNARTSILAAANPVWGRWNKRASAEKNLGLPTALLSRFDLTFVLLDTPEEQKDADLAKHITHVHRTMAHPPLEFEPCSPALLRAFVSKARQYDPYVPPELTEFLVGAYVNLRSSNDVDVRKHRTRFCTPRTLLSILRMSQALARLHFRDRVNAEDVNEAMRLVTVARQSAETSSTAAAMAHALEARDRVSAVFQIIRQMIYERSEKGSGAREGQRLKRVDIVRRLIARGMDEASMDEWLQTYEGTNVYSMTRDGAEIRLM